MACYTVYPYEYMPAQFRMASPCSAAWEHMPGDDRVRFCPQGNLNVYNFSALSPSEIDRLILQHEGRLCGRYYQRADGTMLAQNSSTRSQIHPAKKSVSMVFVDPSGATLPHTKVTVHEESGDEEFTAESNDDGEASFSDLPSGTYAVTATFPGFRVFHLSGVKVPYSATMHLPMELGASTGDVVVVRQPNYQPNTIRRFFSNVKHFF
jgi:hypothetical protein